jgi:hypothetical protein
MLRPSFLPLFTRVRGRCVLRSSSARRRLWLSRCVLREGPVLGPTARHHQMALPSRAVEGEHDPAKGVNNGFYAWRRRKGD